MIFCNLNKSNSLTPKFYATPVTIWLIKNLEEHECDKCGRTFDSAAQLKFHKVSAHDQDVTGYECKQCGKMLSSEQSLEVHMETHEFLEELEIRCKVCRKTFTTEKALMLHEETAHIEEVIMKVTD